MFGTLIVVLVVLSVVSAIIYMVTPPRGNAGWVAFFLLALAAVIVYTHGNWPIR